MIFFLIETIKLLAVRDFDPKESSLKEKKEPIIFYHALAENEYEFEDTENSNDFGLSSVSNQDNQIREYEKRALKFKVYSRKEQSYVQDLEEAAKNLEKAVKKVESKTVMQQNYSITPDQKSDLKSAWKSDLESDLELERKLEWESDRELERKSERESDRVLERKSERESDRKLERKSEMEWDREFERKPERESDREMERKSERESDPHSVSSHSDERNITNDFDSLDTLLLTFKRGDKMETLSSENIG